MANVQITHDTSPQNARSESCVAINPNNPLQVVAASKKFVNIQTYDFSLATEYSEDGGRTWYSSPELALPTGATVMTDPTLAWDDIGNVYLVGLIGNNPPTWDSIGMTVYKSTDGGKTWSAGTTIHESSGDDKQWAVGDANPASPFHGHVYAVWDDTNDSTTLFARSTDNGASWTGTAASPAAGAQIFSGTYYPEIDVSENGTVFVVTIGGDEIDMLTSDDGGDTFTQVATPPASGITTLSDSLPAPYGFPQFPGGTFRVLTDPTIAVYGDIVLVAWADYREGVSRIYYSRSVDGGATWTTPTAGSPLLTGSPNASFQHFHPQMAVDQNGVFGCVFYEFGPKPATMLIDVNLAQSFDGGQSFGYSTITDQPWDPTVDAPWSHGDSQVTFIGDYMGLSANVQGFVPVWTDTRTGIQELWTQVMPEKGCMFVLEYSTYGEDEVTALKAYQGTPDALFTEAFRVIVDGFTAVGLGVTGPSSKLDVTTPTAGMTITCTGNESATGGYGPGVQRFTFNYNVSFQFTGAPPKPTAFAFAAPTEPLVLQVSVPDATAEAEIELIKQPNPYITHGDPSWLSIDLRVFVMRPGDKKFGITMGADATKANGFIQQVMFALSQGNGTADGQSFDDPTVLSPDEATSALYLTPTDAHGKLVFNYALARVRYRGLIGASNVQVFFRLFAAQVTTSQYDYPPGVQYRRGTNGAGLPIALAGVASGEYVTIPFFSHSRVDTTLVSMVTQTDGIEPGWTHAVGNVQTINGDPTGKEIDTFFGCWLDTNQPFKPGTMQPNNILPVRAEAPLDGKFTDASNPPLPLAQVIARNLHQCLIAEVAFGPDPIPVGANTSDNDKLAQRNIDWAPVGSAQALSTFEIRPTSPTLVPGQLPDELMIDWGELPHGSEAQIYIPAVGADAILSLATRLYTAHPFARVDDDTLACPARGVTYLPIPPGTGPNYAGLLSITPSSGLRRGDTYDVVVRQLTSAYGVGRVKSKRDVATGEAEVEPASATVRRSQWRLVIGAFQLTIPVSEKSFLLPREELQLSVLRWIGEAIEPDTRWYPVFHRYLQGIAGRVEGFGGDPTKILPSPTGGLPLPGAGGFPPPPHGGHPGHHPSEPVTGKIAALRFDQFGDFIGFTLESGDHRHEFDTRERHVADLAERVWREQLRITVFAFPGDRLRPETIVIDAPPVAFPHT